MADQGAGWQTVLPVKTTGMDRLSRTQLEEYERQILREWDMSRGHWSGLYGSPSSPVADRDR